MANIEKVSGVFGGIKTDEPIQNCVLSKRRKCERKPT